MPIIDSKLPKSLLLQIIYIKLIHSFIHICMMPETCVAREITKQNKTKLGIVYIIAPSENRE